MITPELRQSILNILSENFTGDTSPDSVRRLADLQQALVLGADPLMKCPDDIRSGPVLKLISRLQMEKVLASRTYTRLHEAVERHFSSQTPPPETPEPKAQRVRKAPPSKDAMVEVKVSENRRVTIPMGLVKAVGSRKLSNLAVAAVLTEHSRSVEELIEMSRKGELSASERAIRQALKSFAELDKTGLDGFFYVQEAGQCWFKLETPPR